MLPVADVSLGRWPRAETLRRKGLVLPFAPTLAPLLDDAGLLGPVAKLESCRDCERLSLLCHGNGKKAEKNRKALEVRRFDVKGRALFRCTGVSIETSTQCPSLNWMPKSKGFAPAQSPGRGFQSLWRRLSPRRGGALGDQTAKSSGQGEAEALTASKKVAPRVGDVACSHHFTPHNPVSR